MQQTDKYKLNLVEKDDVFSPEALNENMEKVEGALEAARAEAAALDQRLQVFEARHVAIGTYTPASDPLDIDLGFEPKAVLILASNKHFFSGMLVAGVNERSDAVLIPNGFRVSAKNATSNGAMLNCQSYTFSYLALG